MFGSNVLEVAVGIIFIYLLLSLICSAVNELIASLLNKRGKSLFEGIKNILNDPDFIGLAQQLYTHGLIQGISRNAADPDKPNRLPSYISPDNFSLALIDIFTSKGISERGEELLEIRRSELNDAKLKLDIKPDDTDLLQNYEKAKELFKHAEQIKDKADIVKQANADAERAAAKVTGLKNMAALRDASSKLENALSLGRSMAENFPGQLYSIQKGIETLPRGHTKESLLVLVTKTQRELPALESQIIELQKNLEEWFNHSMDRINGWYKRWSQKIILAVAFLLIIVLNADTIMLVKKLSYDSVLRAAIVNAAEKEVQNPAFDERKETKNLLEESENIGIPFGWYYSSSDVFSYEIVPKDFVGWLLKLLGFFITLAAVSLGAPFWFDTLKKVVNIRSAGIPPDRIKSI